MSLREKAETILGKIKKYQVDSDGWKPAKNSVSKKSLRGYLRRQGNSKTCLVSDPSAESGEMVLTIPDRISSLADLR